MSARPSTRSAPKARASSRTSPRPPPRRPKGRLRRMTEGDRPYVFALFGLLVLLATMALGPLQGYTTAADRVDELEAARDQLSAEVDALDEQRERLNDPEEVELLARADLGLVKPGELPYVVVTPEPEFRDVGPDEPTEPEPDAAWYRRLGRTLAEWFGVS